MNVYIEMKSNIQLLPLAEKLYVSSNCLVLESFHEESGG